MLTAASQHISCLKFLSFNVISSHARHTYIPPVLQSSLYNNGVQSLKEIGIDWNSIKFIHNIKLIGINSEA